MNSKKDEFSQLELFSQSNITGINSPARRKSGSFKTFYAHYQKVILMIIAFISTGIIAFSLGVEKGRRTVAIKSNLYFDTAQKLQAPANTQKIIRPEYPAVTAAAEAQKQNLQGAYTIQVATYQEKTNAQQEANILKKNGFTALIISKGIHSVLCVGNFSNKETARPFLAQLKKRYHDCFIRRL